jgi:hypothetical protein
MLDFLPYVTSIMEDEWRRSPSTPYLGLRMISRDFEETTYGQGHHGKQATVEAIYKGIGLLSPCSLAANGERERAQGRDG